MGSIGSPEQVFTTPRRFPLSPKRTFSTSKKQRSRTDGGSWSSKRHFSGASSPGRFIPRRCSVDIGAANYYLQSPCGGSNDWSNEVFEEVQSWCSTSARQQRVRMLRLSEGASERRILHFGPEVNHSRGEFEIDRLDSRTPTTRKSEMTFAKPNRTLPKHPTHVLDLPNLEDDYFTHNMCWSADGHLVAGLSNRLYTCALEGEGTTLLRDIGKERSYAAVACNSSGTLLAASTNDIEVQIWDLKTMKLVHTYIHTHTEGGATLSGLICRLVSLDWRTNTNVLAVGCGFGQMEILDMRDKSSFRITMREGRVNCVSAVKFSPNGSYLAASNSHHSIVVWDMAFIRQDALFFAENAHASAIRTLSWYPFKNSILASGGGVDDGFIKIWNVHTGQTLHEISVRAQVCEVLWSPETRELLTSQSKGEKHSVVAWSYPDMNKVGSLAGHGGRILHMAFSPDRTQLATAAADETLRIWQFKPDSTASSAASTKPKTSSFIFQGLR